MKKDLIRELPLRKVSKYFSYAAFAIQRMHALVNKSEIFQQKVKQMMDDEKFRFAHLLLNYYNIQKQLAAALQKDLYSENVQKLFTLVTFLYKF